MKGNHMSSNLIYSHSDFKLNKYFKWYLALIAKALLRPQKKELGFERHHILPRSMAGSDTIDNLVYLTTREHFIAHAFLARCTTGKSLISMS
jgi:hypothetical protein